MTTTIPYGRAELQRAYQRNLLLALLSSSLLVLSLLSVYHIAETFLSQDQPKGPHVRIIDLTRWIPSIPHPTVPNIHFAPGMARPSFGIPVPVPESELNPEVTFGLPNDDPDNSGTFADSGNGADLLGRWLVDDPIPDPGEFIPRESEPMPITAPVPAYPELARRLTLQGTVWVKAFVDKEGTVRKVLVLKSEAEIFNQAALEAASRWTFRPALMNNRPVAVWVGIPFRFRLE